MKISIVTISFNQNEYVEAAIRSVIGQKYKNIEYIIVDPGSIDGSREIIESYKEHISWIIFDPDAGPADGLNKGFSGATGDIYGFLNSDDVLEPGALEEVASFFIKNPTVDVVSGASWIINSNGRKLRKFFSDRYSLWMAARGASIVSQSSTFFRASAFNKTAGFNKGNRIAWDGELFADMALNGAKFHCVRNIWSQFRIHEEGITGSGKFEVANNEYAQMLFRKIECRQRMAWDGASIFFAKQLRKLLNPRDALERIFHGPIYKRKS
jgi:glycosyltransferase involved in cell wall biosynthesis